MQGAIGWAVKAVGALVKVEPEVFLAIVKRYPSPLVIYSKSESLFRVRHHYATSYKGFAFLVSCPEPLPIPGTAEVVVAKEIVVPL